MKEDENIAGTSQSRKTAQMNEPRNALTETAELEQNCSIGTNSTWMTYIWLL